MPSAMFLKLTDFQDDGGPLSDMSAYPLWLFNCSNLVIPAAFDSSVINVVNCDRIWVPVVFDRRLLVNITAGTIPHVNAQQWIGWRLSDLLEVTKCAITQFRR